MQPLSSQTKQQLQNAGVSALYLFGSRAQGTHTTQSDYDFGILLKDPSVLKRNESELYQTLYAILGSLTQPETLEADVIDIVYLDSSRVPLELKSFVVRTGILLFDPHPQERADKESLLMLATADFAPLRQQMSHALMERPTV